MKAKNKLGLTAFCIFFIGYLVSNYEDRQFEKAQELEWLEIQKSHDQYEARFKDRLFPDYSGQGPGRKLYTKDTFTYEDLKIENAIEQAFQSMH